MKLLTVQQAADLLGMKVPTIRLWIARRKLAHVKLNRSVRVPEGEVERLIQESTVPALGERNGR